MNMNKNTDINTKKNIVILGGGIAGIQFITRLSKIIDHTKYQLTLIDKNEFHTWKPMLHTFAAGSASPQQQGMYFLIQAKRYKFIFQPGEVGSLDVDKKQITLSPYIDQHGDEILPERFVNYDYMVVALGSKTNDFNTKGVKEFAYTIDDVGNALSFYHDLKNYIIQAAILKQKHYVVIVGAGATGVELAGEIIHVLQESSHYTDDDFTQYIDLTIVQSGDRVLPIFKESVSAEVQATMDKIGIRTLLSSQVAEVTKGSVILHSGEVLSADQTVWTAGVKAPDVLQQYLDVERSKIGQLVVNDKFQLLKHPEIFAIGDCSSVQDNPLPPTAQAANQQAIYLSKYFKDIITDKPNIPQFVYKDYGALVSVGRYASFGTFGNNLNIKGGLAHLTHSFLYRSHQMSILGVGRGIGAIAADYLLKFSK